MTAVNKARGRRLEAARRAKNWTQEELAAQLGVRRQALALWEAGGGIRDHRLRTLAQLLDMDPAALVDPSPANAMPRRRPTDADLAYLVARLDEHGRRLDLLEAAASEGRKEDLHTVVTSR